MCAQPGIYFSKWNNHLSSQNYTFLPCSVFTNLQFLLSQPLQEFSFHGLPSSFYSLHICLFSAVFELYCTLILSSSCNNCTSAKTSFSCKLGLPFSFPSLLLSCASSYLFPSSTFPSSIPRCVPVSLCLSAVVCMSWLWLLWILSCNRQYAVLVSDVCVTCFLPDPISSSQPACLPACLPFLG